MPAHLSAAKATAAITSAGNQVTELQWRANRLADAIARRCANARVCDRAALVDAATTLRAIRVEAAALAAVTHAANNCHVVVTAPCGAMTTVVRRDSARSERPASVPARPWRRRRRLPVPPADPRPVAPLARAVPAVPRCAAVTIRLDAARQHTMLRRAASDFTLRRTLTERHASSAPSPTDPTERFEALRARIAARAANATGRNAPQPTSG